MWQTDTEDVIAKGNLTEEIAFYAEEVRRMSRQPNTEEVMREDDDSSILMILIWCALNVANNIV
jgi:hypothetical protein